MRLALSKEGAPSPLSVRQWFMFGTLIVWIVWAMTTESSSSSAAPLSISSADETYSTPPAQAHGRMTAETPSKSGDSDYDTIPGQYIVTYTDWTIFNATATMLELLQEFAQEALSLTDEELETILGDVHILHHYHTEALAGVTMSGVWSAPLIAFWQDHPLIHSVEADSRVSLDAITAKNLQYNPPNWGLDRIDESSMAVGRQQSKAALNREYAFDQTGKGVIVFVVDTGIRGDHIEFGQRGDAEETTPIMCGYDAMNRFSPCFDGVGHGTYVASIIGGHVFGVAKGVQIVSVKVFADDGFGTVGSVLAGLDLILRSKRDNPEQHMIANLSWGAMSDSTVAANLATVTKVIHALIQHGVTVVASAGNEAADSCHKFPAGMANVITVGATDIDDRVAPYSNLGKCVTVLAPGTSVTSAWVDGKHAQATLSGTSGAAAHVTGVLALILERYPNSTPADLTKRLTEMAQRGALDGFPDKYKETANLLLNMGDLVLTRN